MFAVNILSQYIHKLSILHWVVVKRILRFLKGITDYGLFLNQQLSTSLLAFADIDWAGKIDDTSAYVIFLGAIPISWSSRKKPIVARSSSAKVEYWAIASTPAEVN